jgi:signal transduction histidine kinase
MKTTSLTRQLTMTVLLLELLSFGVLVSAAILYEEHTHFRAFDVMLRGRADSLLGAVQDADDAADNVMMDLTGLDVPKEDLYRVEDEKGRILGESARKGWENALPPEGRIVATMVDGRNYRVIRIRGVRVVDPGEHGGVPHQISVIYGVQTGHVWHQIFEAVRFYAVASLIALGLTALAMAWMMRRGLEPLYELAAKAERLSATHLQFEAPSAAKEVRELRPLSLALESALARLDRSFRQQKRLTSDAAHELKTDVAIAKSSLQLLTMRPRTVEEYQRGLERCLEDNARIEKTVQDMLTLARVDHRQSPVNDGMPLQCAMRLVLEKGVEQSEALAQLRQIRVLLSAMADPIVGIEERDGLLLCSNLLLNALQHSPPGSTVRVSLGADEQEMTLTISDEGPGIATKDLVHVFEPFYRSDDSRDRKSGGTGLGLSICKAICERVKGSISLVNGARGGALATVRLPVLHLDNVDEASVEIKEEA